jgi:hypothetical protein
MYQIKKEITKEEIVNNFNYYDLVALQSALEINFVKINSTRMDIDARKLKVIKKNEELGVMQYGIFYSHKTLKKIQEQAELIGTLVETMLKLKEKEAGFPKFHKPKEVNFQYYAEDYKQVWSVIFEEGKWFLVRKDDIPVKPTNWSD